ncbi:MAG: thermonuclease family protein [Acidimicrobiia bacterium]
MSLLGARRRALVALLVVVCWGISSCDTNASDASSGAKAGASPSSTAGTTADVPDGVDATVTSVTDGDTIRVRLASGADERVRLTGIDTPETKDPRTVVECFGKEASAQTAALLPAGTKVRLEADVEPRDRYGRMLAYVWRVSDGLHVNAALVADGWAAPYRYPPNVKYADEFSELGAQAREHGLGLWAACGGTDTPAGAAGAATTPDTGTPGACDPNYAGACVPVSSSDLDCADVGVRNFQVVGDDPHDFDGDHNRTACE